MARVKIIDQASVKDPLSLELFAWVAEAEGEVPNHFLVEMNFPEFFNAPLMAENNHLTEPEAIRELAKHTDDIVARFSELAIS